MTDAQKKSAEEIAAEAYVVIGAVADFGGVFSDPDVQRALDYFAALSEVSGGRGGEIIPSLLPDPHKPFALTASIVSKTSRASLAGSSKSRS